MEFEEVKEYIDRVKDSEKFKELDEFTHMTCIEKDKDKDIYENIKYYLSIYHSRRDCSEFFQPDYEYFIRFLEHYLNNKTAETVFDERGWIDLGKTLHIVRPRRFLRRRSSS